MPFNATSDHDQRSIIFVIQEDKSTCVCQDVDWHRDKVSIHVPINQAALAYDVCQLLDGFGVSNAHSMIGTNEEGSESTNTDRFSISYNSSIDSSLIFHEDKRFSIQLLTPRFQTMSTSPSFPVFCREARRRNVRDGSDSRRVRVAARREGSPTSFQPHHPSSARTPHSIKPNVGTLRDRVTNARPSPVDIAMSPAVRSEETKLKVSEWSDVSSGSDDSVEVSCFRWVAIEVQRSWLEHTEKHRQHTGQS